MSIFSLAVVRKLIAKLIRKSFRKKCNKELAVVIDELDFHRKDGKVVLTLKLNANIDEQDFSEIIESISEEI